MESSKDKTKRLLTSYLGSYQWLYQYSIFCNVRALPYEKAKIEAVEWLDNFDDAKLRNYLSKTNNTAILFVIRTSLNKNHPDKKWFKQVYLTMFCNEELNLKSYLESKQFYELNVIMRLVTTDKIASTISTIKAQEPHDLSFLNGKKRYIVINRKLLTPTL